MPVNELRPWIGIDPSGPEDWSEAAVLEPLIRSMWGLTESFIHARESVPPADRALGVFLFDADEAEDCIRLVRSPLGAAEDPHGWTMPGSDQMRWTAPETDGEVPRWLA